MRLGLLPALLVKLAESSLDLPEFLRQSDLLGQDPCLLEVLYREALSGL